MIFARAFKGHSNIALGGIALTTISLIIAPSVKLGLFLILHVGLFLLFLRPAKPRKFAKWGAVKDAASGKPIGNAIVRLFEPEYNKLLGTQITKCQGPLRFPSVGLSIHYLTFEKTGYKILRTKNIDMRTKTKEAIITEKVKLETLESKK